jgi:hypothetical protein
MLRYPGTDFASSPGAEISYEWSTSPDFDPIIGVTSEILAMPGDPIAIYYVRTTDNQTGCQALASVQVANYEVDIDLIGDTLICLDQSAIISVVPGMEAIPWACNMSGHPLIRASRAAVILPSL